MSTKFVPATGWELFLPWYDWMVARFACEVSFKSRCIKHLEAIEPKQTILDAGCGTGTLATMLAKSFPASNIIGVDIDSRVLEVAKRKSRKLNNIRWEKTSIDALPLDDLSTDCICSTLVMHHLTDTQKVSAMQEFRRVLREDGVFLMVDFGPPWKLLSRIRFLVVQVIDGWESTRSNANGQLLAMAQAAGFVLKSPPWSIDSPLGTIHLHQFSNQASARSVAQEKVS